MKYFETIWGKREKAISWIGSNKKKSILIAVILLYLIFGVHTSNVRRVVEIDTPDGIKIGYAFKKSTKFFILQPLIESINFFGFYKEEAIPIKVSENETIMFLLTGRYFSPHDIIKEEKNRIYIADTGYPYIIYFQDDNPYETAKLLYNPEKKHREKIWYRYKQDMSWDEAKALSSDDIFDGMGKYQITNYYSERTSKQFYSVIAKDYPWMLNEENLERFFEPIRAEINKKRMHPVYLENAIQKKGSY